MASQNAKLVANKVLENLGKGKRIIMGEILREVGYADNTADNPKNVTDTKTYKETISPIVSRWQKEIERIQAELERRSLSDEKYKELVDSIDKLNKQVQLATGGDTERFGVKPIPIINVPRHDTEDEKTDF